MRACDRTSIFHPRGVVISPVNEFLHSPGVDGECSASTTAGQIQTEVEQRLVVEVVHPVIT